VRIGLKCSVATISILYPFQGRSQEFILTEARGLMASAGARAYNGGLGAEPPAGSRGRAPGQGVRGRSPPEAERL